jgi:hypothetical protein
MAKSTAVAKRPANRVATRDSAVPTFFKGKEGAGTENIATKDMEMPRIRLIQGTDEELIAAHDGMKIGDFFQTLAETNLGPELDIVPLHISKRVVLWRPRPPIDAGGILARADDAVHWQPADKEFTVKIDKKGHTVTWKTAKTVDESGLLEWGTYDPEDDNSQPAATLCHVFVVALPAYPELSPCVLMLQRSAIKSARKLLGKVNIIGGQAPIYGQVYKMGSVGEANSAGQKYRNYTFMANGFVQDEDEFKAYEGLHEQFKKDGVQIKDMENAQEDLPEGKGGGGAPAEAPKDRRTGKSRY